MRSTDEGPTAIGIVVAFVGLAVGATMEGSQTPGLLQHPRAPDHPRRHARRRRSPAPAIECDEGDPELYKKAIGGRHAGPHARARAARRLRRARPPRGPAGARRRARRRSTTSSPGRACSSSSTAPTPSWSPRSSRPRSTAWRAPPAPARSRLREGRRLRARRIGIIGTVMGLVHVLENLDDPATLGPAISGAFIATLYGVGSANVIFLPIGQPPEGALRGGGRAAHADARGHPRDPGRRQPARRRREAAVLHPARRARRARTRGPARPPPRPPTPRRRPRHERRAGAAGRRPRHDGGARERRALAAHLRRHDHAADGAVHGAVLDLVGEHVEVRGAPEALQDAFSGKILLGRQVDPADRRATPKRARPRRRSPPIPPIQADRASSSTQARAEQGAAAKENEDFKPPQGAASTPTRSARSGRTRSQTDRRTPRARHPAAHRQRALRLAARPTLKPGARPAARPLAELLQATQRPPDRRRGPHRRPADPQLALPDELGAVRPPARPRSSAFFIRDGVADRPARGLAATARSTRSPRNATADGRVAQPPGRDRPHAQQ